MPLLVLRWQRIIRAQGFNVPYRHLFMYKLAGYAISYITPSAHVGGEPVRAYLLKRDNVPFPKAMSSVIIDKSFDLTVNTLFGTLLLLLVIANLALPSNTMMVLLALSLLSSGLIFLFYYRTLKGKGFFILIFRLLGLNRR